VKAAAPQIAIPLYESFCKMLKQYSDTTVQTGVFGAEMEIGLINDGPVTILIDSKRRE
jgi:D-tyrosyl-tRNA(Tyr) deacylase